MKVVEILLHDLPAGYCVEQVVMGNNWTLVAISKDGAIYAGLASAPHKVSDADRVTLSEELVRADAGEIAHLALSSERARASVGVAILNAIYRPDQESLSNVDAADWLSEAGRGKRVAIFGRFPFIEDELKPVADEVWVFERSPQPGEFGAEHMPEILPEAEIVAITSSTLINHTIDDILSYINPASIVMMLGPGTPLTFRLFHAGFDLLSGVQVTDLDAARQSVLDGVSFRHMEGLERVTLCNKHTVLCES